MSSIPPIKPIETAYQGYRMRSRLEARWAIFFDELCIPWQYEVEGFELGHGLRYLPDFYLPTHDVFVEVKPSLSALSKRDWDTLARFIDHKPTLLACGMPGTKHLYLFQPCSLGGQGDVLQEFLEDYFEDSVSWERFFMENFADNVVALTHTVRPVPPTLDTASDEAPLWGFICRAWLRNSEFLLNKAAATAKSARFEFNEKRDC